MVPAEPGGGIDQVARLLAKGIAPTLAQSVIVINRSGASGNVGTASVARSEPDGYTLLLTGVGHLVSPLLHGSPGYEPLKDFVPVAKIANAPNVLVVHESLKGMSLAQLLEDPRSRTAGLAYASAGYGHSSHLAAEVFMTRTGASWLHVPYRGTGPASRALIAGEVQLMFVPAGSVQALLATGRAFAVAVAHPQRLASLPSTPTFAEQAFLGPSSRSGTVSSHLPARRRRPPRCCRTPRWASSPMPRSSGNCDRWASSRRRWTGQQFAAFLGAQSKRLGTLVNKERVEGSYRSEAAESRSRLPCGRPER